MRDAHRIDSALRHHCKIAPDLADIVKLHSRGVWTEGTVGDTFDEKFAIPYKNEFCANRGADIGIKMWKSEILCASNGGGVHLNFLFYLTNNQIVADRKSRRS